MFWLQVLCAFLLVAGSALLLVFLRSLDFADEPGPAPATARPLRVRRVEQASWMKRAA